MFCLWPEPIRRAITKSPRASCALVCTCLADIDRGESGHAGAWVEARGTGNARVNDHANTIDSKRTLGNIGRKHNAPSPRTAGRKSSILFFLGKSTSKRKEVDCAFDNAFSCCNGAANFADAWQENQNIAFGFTKCTNNSCRNFVFKPLVVASLTFAHSRRAPPVNFNGKESATR